MAVLLENIQNFWLRHQKFRFNWTYSKEIELLSWKFHWNKFRLRLFALKFSNFALAKLAYWVSLTFCSHSAAWILDWKCGKRIAINPSKCRQYKRKEEIFCWNGKFVVGFGQYNFKTSWPQKISTFKKHFTLKITLILMIDKRHLTFSKLKK